MDHLAKHQKYEEIRSKKHNLNSKFEQQILEARIKLWKLNYKDSLKIIKEVESQLKEDEKKLKFICLLTKIYLFWVGQLGDKQDNINKVFEDLETSYNSFTSQEKRELSSFEAQYFGWMGVKEAWWDWNLKKGISYFEKARKGYEKLDYEIFIITPLNNIGLAYTLLGELDKGLDLLIQASQLNEKYDLHFEKLLQDSFIGTNHLYRGDLETALNYYLESAKGHENYGSNIGGIIYQQLIFIYTELGRLDEARFYLTTIQNEKPKYSDSFIEHCTAIILRKSQRGRDKAKAQEFFAKRVYNKDMRHFEFSEAATFYLESLFEELEAFGGDEILQEIQSLSDRMQTQSERFGDSKLQITTLIGKSKMAFITSDLQNAEQYLSEAEKLIQEKNIMLFFDQIESERRILENHKTKILDLGGSHTDIRKKMDLAEYKKYLDYAKRIAGRI